MKTDSIEALRDMAQRLAGARAELQGPAQQAVIDARKLLDKAGAVSDDAALRALIQKAEESLKPADEALCKSDSLAAELTTLILLLESKDTGRA